MKKILVIMSIAIAILFGVQNDNQAEAHTTVSFSLFYDALAPYGNWMSVPDYGYVWQPTYVGQGWRPYSDGHWVWTDYGWTWVSYQPWGWAPYHYGRWVFLPPYGWVWMPGTVWAPAWVTWYTGPSYIGWAPLPPDNNFFLQIGLGPIAFSYSTRPNDCVFVRSNFFLYSNINSVAIPPSQNITIINNTTNINNITIVNNRVINHGPDTRFVEKATGVRVQRVNVVENNLDPQAVVKGGAKTSTLGRNLYVFRPTVVKKGNEAPHLIRGENIKGSESNQPSVNKRGEVSNQPPQQGFKKQGSGSNQPSVYKGGEASNQPSQQGFKRQGSGSNQPSVYKRGEVSNQPPQQGFKKQGSGSNQPSMHKRGEASNPPTHQDFTKKGSGSNRPSGYNRGDASTPLKHQDFKKNGGQTGNPPVHEQRKVTKPSGQPERKKDEGK
jgi:uncharacterized protein DUF6600